MHRLIKADIDALAGFTGARYHVRATGEVIDITPSHIRSRELLLAIPSDAPDSRLAWVTELMGYANEKGVRFIIVKLD